MEENYPTQPNPTASIPPPPKSPGDNLPKAYPSPRFLSKKLAAIILILIFAGISISAVYAFSNRSSGSKNEITKSTSPTPAPKITWKTYEGDEFSFEYPSMLNVGKADNQRNIITSTRSSALKISNNSSGDSYYLQIYTEDTKDNSAKEILNSYVDILRSTSRPNDPSNKEVINKINNSGSEYKNGEVSGFKATLGFDYDFEMIIVVRGNKAYFFEYGGAQGQKITKDQEKVIYQILSTFKFTN